MAVLRHAQRRVFQVHRRAVIGMYGGAGWAPTDRMRRTVDEVRASLGEWRRRLAGQAWQRALAMGSASR